MRFVVSSGVVLASALLADQASAQIPRSWLGGAWTEAQRIEDQDGSLLGTPVLVARCGRVFVVVDQAGNRVVALNREGRALWSVGRRGAGPGEFRSPSALSCDSENRVAIFDDANARITMISDDGKLVGAVPTEQRTRQVAQSRINDAIGTVTWRSDELYSLIDGRGRRIDSVAAPSWHRGLSLLAREQYLAALSDGGFVSVFRWSGRMVRTSASGAVLFDRLGIDGLPFPSARSYPTPGAGGGQMIRIDPSAVEAARAVVELDGVLLVLHGGAGPTRGRVLDHFDSRSGTYLGSSRLAIEPLALAADGRELLAIRLDPIPAIIRFRWVPGRRSP